MADKPDHSTDVHTSAKGGAARRRRLALEPTLTRLLVICGVVGIGVALGAILRANETQGWEIGLIVALVTLVLSRILFRRR